MARLAWGLAVGLAVFSTALYAQRAAERLFRQGVMAGGAMSHPGELGKEGVEHLKA